MNKFEVLERKIFREENLDKILALWRFKERKIVFTNGCFDLLHYGHVDYLAKAASMGDELIIGVNTDASVNRLKGPHRPVNDEKSRLHNLAGFFFVSGVILFDEPTPLELIRRIQPDVLVKGSDYKPEEIVGYDIVTAKGGKVVTIDFVPGYSTSGLEQKIRNSAG